MASAYFQVGAGYAEKNKIDEAFVMFTHALATDYTFADAYVAKGLLYLRQGDLWLALYNFDLALMFDDKHAEAYLGRALAYAKEDMYSEALFNACRAVDLNPINETFIKARDQFYAKLIIK
jgi:Tfp pilus assembly protein PilF